MFSLFASFQRSKPLHQIKDSGLRVPTVSRSGNETSRNISAGGQSGSLKVVSGCVKHGSCVRDIQGNYTATNNGRVIVLSREQEIKLFFFVN